MEQCPVVRKTCSRFCGEALDRGLKWTAHGLGGRGIVPDGEKLSMGGRPW